MTGLSTRCAQPRGGEPTMPGDVWRGGAYLALIANMLAAGRIGQYQTASVLRECPGLVRVHIVTFLRILGYLSRDKWEKVMTIHAAAWLIAFTGIQS